MPALPLDLPEVRVRVRDGEVSVEPIPSLRSRDLVTEAVMCIAFTRDRTDLRTYRFRVSFSRCHHSHRTRYVQL